MIDRSITGSDNRPGTNGPNSLFGGASQFGNSEMEMNYDDEEMVRDRPNTKTVLSENIGHQMGHYFPFEASLYSEYLKEYSHFEVTHLNCINYRTA